MRTIQQATARFASAATCSTAGALNPTAARPAEAPAPATMNSAFMTLFAAIMRDRSPGAELSWMIA